MSPDRIERTGPGSRLAVALGSGIVIAIGCGACSSPEHESPIAEEPRAKEASASTSAEATGPGATGELERGHYTIVPPADDPELSEEVSLRLAAVREQLLAELPPRHSGGGAECTVRIWPDRSRYVEAGGPAGSSCFFDAKQREMVLYDDRDETRENTALWSSLQHIAVHEYFDDALGLELQAVPPWLLYGTAAVYAGLEYESGELQLAPNDPRAAELDAYLAERSALPLDVLLNFTPAEFYGANEHDSGGRRNLVLAWSVALFLRTGSDRASEWEDAWSRIVPRLVGALQAGKTGRPALDEALAGADLNAIDRSWRSWLSERSTR